METTRAHQVPGGQTGADRAALDSARSAGVPYAGWCPAGGWAEDRPDPPGVLADHPDLTPTPEEDPTVRTRLNVRDSDATLVVATADEAESSPGTSRTVSAARELARPLLVTASLTEAVAWLDRLPPDLVLNVAGPRESERPGTYARTRELLDALLRARATSG